MSNRETDLCSRKIRAGGRNGDHWGSHPCLNQGLVLEMGQRESLTIQSRLDWIQRLTQREGCGLVGWAGRGWQGRVAKSLGPASKSQFCCCVTPNR